MSDVTAAAVVEQMRVMMDGTWEYRFGAELGRPPNSGGRYVDCSEATEAAVRWAAEAAGSSLRLTDGSFAQYDACAAAGTLIPLDEARRTPGTLVFLSKTEHVTPGMGRNGIYHVGLVADPDTVYEACCSDGDPVRPSPFDARDWHHLAGRIPGVTYTTTRRRPDMILVQIETSVYMVAAPRPTGIANPTDLEQIQQAMRDPGHIAVIGWDTWQNISTAAAAD